MRCVRDKRKYWVNWSYLCESFFSYTCNGVKLSKLVRFSSPSEMNYAKVSELRGYINTEFRTLRREF